MSNKLHVGGLVSGTTYCFTLTNSAGNYYNTVTPAFEAYNASNIAHYANSAGTANSNGDWFGAIPAVAADDYDIVVRSRAGGSLALSDAFIAGGTVPFDGTNIVNSRAAILAPAGLDGIPMTAPAGRPTTFTQSMVMLFRRFYNKVVYDSVGNTIKTYANDDATVVTSQATSNVSGVETVGDA